MFCLYRIPNPNSNWHSKPNSKWLKKSQLLNYKNDFDYSTLNKSTIKPKILK